LFGASVILVARAAAQGAGRALSQGLKPERDKVKRMHAQSPASENGFVWVPREAHWLDAYLHELTTFPASKHSDQVDSTSQALAWMGTKAVDPELLAKAMEHRLSSQ